MNFLQSDKKTIFVMLAIYLISNSFLLLNYNGIYWDDWTLFNNSSEVIKSQFSGATGSLGILVSSLHFLLLEVGVFSYRALTVVLLFISSIFVYKVLQKLDFFSKEDIFFITVFFLLAPLYSAKIALIDFPYTFFSTFFFFAFYLLSNNIDNLGILKRLMTLSLLFISFVVNSLLVFYALILMYMFYKLHNQELTLSKNITNFIRTKLDFILLPVVFYIVKSIYFSPSNLYAGYNSISLANLIKIPFTFTYTLYSSFSKPIELSFSSGIVSFWFFIIVFFLTIVHFAKKVNLVDYKERYDQRLFVLGLILFLFGAFAYLAVGKIPSDSDWDSRHQLLLPLGFSFILYFGLKNIFHIFHFNNISKSFVLFLLVSAFIGFHIKDGIDYGIDWRYQQSIIENIKKSKIINENSTFIVTSDLDERLAKNRTFRAYELNGMSKMALGCEDKLFVMKEIEIEEYKKYRNYKQYNFSNWNYSSPVNIIISESIENGFKGSRLREVVFLMKLKYFEIFKKDRFSEEILKLVTIKSAE